MNSERLPRLVEPKPRKNRSRKIIYLLFLFFITLLAVLFFRSDLSKVDTIEISGNRYSSLDEIGQTIRITKGDSFFTATAGKMMRRLEKLPYVDKALVTKSFPGSIRVEIAEFPEVAYSLGSDGRMKAVLASGQEVEPIKGEPVQYLPVLSGWESHRKDLKKMCALLERIPGPLLADISQIKPDPTASYPDRIRIYTRSYFEVITTIEYLPDKLDYMRAIIGEYEPGIITMLEANSHQPYDNLKQDESTESDEGASAGGRNGFEGGQTEAEAQPKETT